MVSTSYAGCRGSWPGAGLPQARLGCRPDQTRVAQMNGCLIDVTPITYAAVTDGLSNTMVAAEKTTTTLKGLDSADPHYYQQSGWWFSGNDGDTLVSTYYPINVYKSVPPSGASQHAWRWSVSSLHTGGVNVLMADGAVRFIKDSIDTQPINPVNGGPAPGSTPGVWQALGTRNGGEVIDAAAL